MKSRSSGAIGHGVRASYDELAAEELARVMGTGSEPFLLDVREADEVTAWPMPGALNIPLGELGARVAELPSDRRVVVFCASGNRSSVASKALAGAGFDVANLSGGMAAWRGVYDEAELDVGAATVVQLRRRAKGCLSYLVGSGDEAFVVDPSMDVERYLEAAAARGWRVSRVIDTHLHADHLSGVRELAAATGATIHLNPADSFGFPFEPLSHGDRLPLPGDASVSIATIHSPGHTEGSTLLSVDGATSNQAVLTGDTVFVDGVGRPDLAERAEEFAHSLHKSLQEHIVSLPDDTTVLPAHYGLGVPVRPGEPVAATAGDLRATLEPLSFDEEEFVAWATCRVTPRPPNYVAIIQANMGRSVESSHALRHLEAGPNRCSA